MATKGSSKTKKKNGGNGEKLPDQVEQADLHPMQLLFKELENLQLKKQLMESRVPEIAELNAQMDEVRKQLGEKNHQVNEKYQLNTETDRIDLNTGTITRS